ncbi:TetR family transcriptional regulator [Kribbella antiqua]|uniref:TetR family transcriptional regulator n=1 Tax=Kribbella antiqua TaxID=2512217 RepID=A0A4R2IZ62_9ACTN|nr:TetR/AcrR family transcriptional regulator [Kribbella antiqua]TCO50587.1 TetR family transcriptional regulator [Kribbella antiqua]
MTGLRARKKQQTHDALSEAAIALFLERGFDEVSVADIAAAADVSKPTLFKYFATKQDLVLHRFADHQHEAARVVQASTKPPAEALRDHFLDGLERRDPVTGLNDHPQVLAFYRLVFTTPALETRLTQFIASDQQALAEALGNNLRAEVTAACLFSVHQVLSRRNWQAMTSGLTADKYYPTARAEAVTAFKSLPT